MKLKEIIKCIEDYAPLAYQESYDNAGLICGHSDMEINAALICLDSTEDVLDEAIAKGCNLVIAHHPIVFSGLKKFTGENYIERTIIKAIKNDISIYVAHTNLDNVHNGVSAKIGEVLGLQNTKVLSPKSGNLKKLVTYCPDDVAVKVRTALFNAGAGHIGNYDECSFNISGTGTFRAGNGSKPYVGDEGVLHLENENKIEVIYPSYIESTLIKALLLVHPYEEVAYDLYNITNKNPKIGSGIVGELKAEMDALGFLKSLKKVMKTDCVRYTDLGNKKIRKIAVCGGAGSFLLENAVAAGADIFITGDFKYHQFFDADKRIIIADIGHYESEQFTIDLFYDVLRKKFNTFALLKTEVNTNPIKYL